MFSYGFEDGRTKEEVGTLIGFLGEPSYVSIQETSAFNGTGRKYGQVDADTAQFRDRGFNVDLNLIPGLNLDDFWFGAYVQALSAPGQLGLTRIFGISGSQSLHLDVAVDAGSLTDSVVVRRASASSWTTLTLSSSTWSVVGTSGTDKRFSTSESVLDPDNSWRFVAVNIKIAQEKILVYVDDQLWVETTGTNLYESNTFDRVLFTGYRGTSEAASGPSVVNHDDLWVANEYKIQHRSIPIDMGDVGFFDQATPSDATPIEELVNYPFDPTTYATVEQGDYLSFKLDDSFLVESKATKIGSIKCRLGVSGPGIFTVFLFDGQTKKYMEELSVGGISVQYLDVEFSQNPFTEAPFELEDVKNIEIGIFNGPMPPEPASVAASVFLEIGGASTGFTGSGSRYVCWGFTVSQPVTMVGIRDYGRRFAYTQDVRLWDVTNGNLLVTSPTFTSTVHGYSTQSTVDGSTLEPYDYLFEEPIELVTGVTYAVGRAGWNNLSGDGGMLFMTPGAVTVDPRFTRVGDSVDFTSDEEPPSLSNNTGYPLTAPLVL